MTSLIYKFILAPAELDYLKTIVFILIAALVQLVEMFLKAIRLCTERSAFTFADYNKLRGTRCGTHQRTEGLHDSAGYGLRSGNRNRLYNCHGADGRPAGKDGVQRYPGVIQRNADRSSYGYADVNGIYGIFE